jgi:hypothetical protein
MLANGKTPKLLPDNSFGVMLDDLDQKGILRTQLVAVFDSFGTKFGIKTFSSYCIGNSLNGAIIERNPGMSKVPGSYFWRDAVLLFMHWFCFANPLSYYSRHGINSETVRCVFSLSNCLIIIIPTF